MTIYYFTHKSFGLLYFTVGTGKIKMLKEREGTIKRGHKEVSILHERKKGIIQLGGFSGNEM